MNTKKFGRMLAVCLGTVLFAGCGGEKQNTYNQAEENLELEIIRRRWRI